MTLRKLLQPGKPQREESSAGLLELIDAQIELLEAQKRVLEAMRVEVQNQKAGRRQRKVS